jgi:hypothetical protein
MPTIQLLTIEFKATESIVSFKDLINDGPELIEIKFVLNDLINSAYPEN